MKLDYTKEEFDKIVKDRFLELLEFTGGHAHLAKMLGIPVSKTYRWKTHGFVSKEGAHLVAKNKRLEEKFPAIYLRPDINK